MDPSNRHPSSNLNRQIDAVCVEFERAWLDGRRPTVEEFLPRLPEEARSPGLRELIGWEVSLRREAGEEVSRAEFDERFPENPGEIAAAFKILDHLSDDPPATAPRGSTATADHNPPQEPLPERIGRYVPLGVLGTGGFGVVYLARDDELDRRVAIKVPHPTRIKTPADVEAYLTEARVVAGLKHPNIVPVFDVGRTEDGRCYVISEYIDGGSLAARIRETRPSHHEAAALVAAIADALAYTHGRDLVHRDIKPANILLDAQGTPYLTDFGIALTEEDYGKQAAIVGTLGYMSPEQARGESHRVDGRSDIFSLGVVLYELLTARHPFRADSVHDLLDEIATVEPKPPRQRDRNVPKELQRICLKALSKKVTHRYPTAADMAEDLRAFLEESPENGRPDVTPGVSTPQTPDPATPPTPTPTPTPSDSDEPLRIVPKGLRSFGPEDADFFLELLPGARDRDGLPDSVRFWKHRIEEPDPDHTFAVGLLYGPSGCGKSSLVKAGLLPRLADSTIPTYVEATADQTESRLLRELRKHCPDLPEDLDLIETLTAMRRGSAVPSGKKVLIVLDQFEQWLHAKRGEENTDLVRALRQCDGEHVQAIVMVRDDFWMAATRFMQELEIRLVEGVNSAAVDLFDERHAKRVLTAFGRAFGALPEHLHDLTAEQEQFLEEATAGLAREGKVVCVRLALFAEMIKGKAWMPKTLGEVGGTEGIGVTFLEETFSATTAPPEHRLHQKAARRVLKALLPEVGTEIKGVMRSADELQEVSGYTGRPKAFENLLQILDGELRLVTPMDPEGIDPEDDAEPVPEGAYYQLTHDYLVPSLREWLTRKQKETRRGRAELRLADRAALWNAKPENRHLPSLWETYNIQLVTRKEDWSESQRKMMRRAARIHAVRWGTAMIVLLATSIILWNAFASARRENDIRRAESLVDALLTAPPDAVPHALDNLKPLRDYAKPILQERFADSQLPPAHRLRAALGLAEFGQLEHGLTVTSIATIREGERRNGVRLKSGQVEQSFLVNRIATMRDWECRNVVHALRLENELALNALITEAENVGKKDWPYKARLAVVALHLGEPRIARDMLQLKPDLIERTEFIDTFSTWHGDLSEITSVLKSESDPAFRSGMCIALGSVSPESLRSEEKTSLAPIVRDFYLNSPDGGTHGAARYALVQWNVPLPSIPPVSSPKKDVPWYVNSVGMTMVRIPRGEFMMGSPDSDSKGSDNERPHHRVEITEPFYLCMHEVTQEQYEGLMKKNPSHFKDDVHCPVESVTWDEAVAFCNELSKKEGRKYQLPTETQWEYACRAGSKTEYCFGNGEDQLRQYAWFVLSSGSKTRPVGLKRPNAWGLFDMHGNVLEWCRDWYGRYQDSPMKDPTGPSGGSLRVIRGGCWNYPARACRSACRYNDQPGNRNRDLGFRVSQVADDDPSQQ